MTLDDRIAELTRAVADATKAAQLNSRAPSIAAQVGSGPSLDGYRPTPANAVDAHPNMKASFGSSYVPGTLITALYQTRSGASPAEWYDGKAKLDDLGLAFLEAPEGKAPIGFLGLKATLGTTGATGGYVLPNNLVAPVTKPGVGYAPWERIVTVVPGVAVRGIDQPYRTGAPDRMTAQDWGATKDNVDEAYGTYTATLGTFARIYDIGKQYARFSAGAAETDVLDELIKGARLAEEFSILAGPGTGSATPGINDPTKGLYTSLLGNVFTTNHSPSASTVAGSAAAGLQTAFGTLASRSRTPTAVVMDSVTYWSMFDQGSDTAGFWMSNFLGSGFAPGNAGEPLSLRGVPVFPTPNFNTFTGTTKAAIVGEYTALKLFRGGEFRVDSSDVAGDRWDKNLIGYRGEVEFAVQADTAVAVGAFQLVTNLIP